MSGDLPDYTKRIALSVTVGIDQIPETELTETPIVEQGRYSGTDQTAQTVTSWTVSSDKMGVLKEISLVADLVAHAEITVSIGGTALFTDKLFQTTLTLVFPDLKLVAATVVLVEVESDDGTAIVVDAVITGKEVG